METWSGTKHTATADDMAKSLVETSNGGYAIAGVTKWFAAVGHDFWVHRDFWLVKTDEDGVAPVESEAAWVALPFLFSSAKKKLLHRCS